MRTEPRCNLGPFQGRLHLPIAIGRPNPVASFCLESAWSAKVVERQAIGSENDRTMWWFMLAGQDSDRRPFLSTFRRGRTISGSLKKSENFWSEILLLR